MYKCYLSVEDGSVVSQRQRGDVEYSLTRNCWGAERGEQSFLATNRVSINKFVRTTCSYFLTYAIRQLRLVFCILDTIDTMNVNNKIFIFEFTNLRLWVLGSLLLGGQNYPNYHFLSASHRPPTTQKIRWWHLTITLMCSENWTILLHFLRRTNHPFQYTILTPIPKHEVHMHFNIATRSDNISRGIRSCPSFQ